ncbi:MAG: hypothetical protein M3N48_09985, partial [Verrucomicrobiota bacterium]|nr:hypothetical protein [Verrucomicrobiota bacterium]
LVLGQPCATILRIQLCFRDGRAERDVRHVDFYSYAHLAEETRDIARTIRMQPQLASRPMSCSTGVPWM